MFQLFYLGIVNRFWLGCEPNSNWRAGSWLVDRELTLLQLEWSGCRLYSVSILYLIHILPEADLLSMKGGGFGVGSWEVIGSARAIEIHFFRQPDALLGTIVASILEGVASYSVLCSLQWLTLGRIMTLLPSAIGGGIVDCTFFPRQHLIGPINSPIFANLGSIEIVATRWRWLLSFLKSLFEQTIFRLKWEQSIFEFSVGIVLNCKLRLQFREEFNS